MEGWEKKSLYICTYEEYKKGFYRYRVQAIKFTDLLSSPKPSSEMLREIACKEGFDVYSDMGFGVFGSRIVLAGGQLNKCNTPTPTPFYVLDPVESEPVFKEGVLPTIFQVQKRGPLLQEIQGKLYALSAVTGRLDVHPFNVFNPETKEWASLPPISTEHMKLIGVESSCAVVGTKIYVTPGITSRSSVDSKSLSTTFCFDVAHPEKGWCALKPWLKFEGPNFFFNKALVLDTENRFEKLMFTFEDERFIAVYYILLSAEGDDEPKCVEPVAKLDTAEFPGSPGIDWIVHSYSCAHLGDGTMCFPLMFLGNYNVATLGVFTFRFSYSTSHTPVSKSVSFSDMRCWHLFEYDLTKEPDYLETCGIGGCFVL